jgi:hypothetical protein
MDHTRFTAAEQEHKQAPLELCEWINRGLKKSGRGAPLALAKLLGIRPEMVSRIAPEARAARGELRIIETFWAARPIDIRERQNRRWYPSGCAWSATSLEIAGFAVGRQARRG